MPPASLVAKGNKRSQAPPLQALHREQQWQHLPENMHEVESQEAQQQHVILRKRKPSDAVAASDILKDGVGAVQKKRKMQQQQCVEDSGVADAGCQASTPGVGDMVGGSAIAAGLSRRWTTIIV